MRIRDQAGFSLTELLIASLIMIVITTALFTSLEQTELFFEDYSADMDLRQGARVVLGQMEDEFRMVGYDLGTVAEAISIADDGSFQFAGDVDDGDEDGACDASYETATDGGAERIAYAYDGAAGTLTRTVDCWNGVSWTLGVQSNVVLTNLPAGATIFQYFDGTGTRIPLGGGPLDAAGREDVRSVAIALEIADPEAESLLGEDRAALAMSQHITLRNRRDG